MRWQIEHLVFCDLQQTLTFDQDVEQLEPMVVELLSYFCQNPSRIISRDELVDKVWLGRTITDNAVNRVVTKLRKALSDNPKQPKFIATLPKKGYKFIVTPVELAADSKQVNEQSNHPSANISMSRQAETKNSKKPKLSYLFTLVLIVISIGVMTQLGLFSSNFWQSETVEPITRIKALTRGAGRESQPRVSPDGEFLAFVEFNGDKMRTKIKSLIDEQMVEVSHSEQTNSWVGSLSWSDDGSMVVYLVTTPTSCQYFIRGFDGLSLKPPKLIHNCPQGSYGKIAFTHDNNRLVYTEAEKRNSPFTLFELNLKTGSKKRLNQPIHYLGGNSQFDIHPTENKLLISSPDKQQWEGFYSLDLETDELQLLFKQDAYICCGIWNHQGDRVVLMGEHPAYQLVSYNLRGKDRRVIYSGGQQIGAPERHSNGKDYLLTAGRVNMNTLYFNHQSQTVQLIANSSVDDRLARFSYQGNWVAYISLASGHEEIWLTDVDGNNTRKLTQFTDHRHYVDLIWSYDGAFLLGLALNEIHLINRQTGKASKLKLPQFEIRGVSLKDNQTVSFSSNIDNQWRVTHYDLKSEELSYLEERWSYVRYSEVASDSWWRDQSGQLYVGENQQLMDDPIINKIGPLLGRRFNLKKQANHWYWQVFNNGSYQLYSRVLTEPTEQLELENHSSSYDISSQGILYHQVESSNADIYTSVKE